MNEDFLNWFNSNVTDYSLLSDYFYNDCEIKDKEKHKDMMYNWLVASFTEGYNCGRNESHRA